MVEKTKRAKRISGAKGVMAAAVFVAGLLCAASLFAATRADVDDFLKSYESYVVEWENLAKKSSVSAEEMSRLMEKGQGFEQTALTVVNGSEWTAEDQQKVEALNQRLNQAVLTVSQKIMTAYQ
ncbi:MAG: hypothetical protein LBB82_00210 [Treponema sp.]|nr:hypothetical protein [Treponema sp.]